MKPQVISKIAMWAGIGISALVFALFMLVGFDQTNDEGQSDPQMTPVLIWLAFAFIIILTILTLANLFVSVFKYKDNGLLRVLVAAAIPTVMVIISTLLNQGQEIPAGKECTSFDLALADGFIYPIFIILAVAVIAAIVCASDILSKSAVKGK